MSFLNEEPLSPESADDLSSSSSRRRATDQSTHFDSSHTPMDLLGPSCSADIPGPSTRHSDYRTVNDTDREMQQLRNFYPNADDTELQRLYSAHYTFSHSGPVFGGNSNNLEMRTPNDVVNGNSESDATNAIHVLSDVENDDNNEFLGNPHSRHHNDSVDSSNDYDSSTREQTDSADQLFAPEESSSSSIRNSPVHSLPSGLRTQIPLSFFKFLTTPQNSVNELPSPRNCFRYKRFLRLPSSLSDHRDSENPIRIGATNRIQSSLLYQRSRLLHSRLRMRLHSDLLRHKTTSALNAVTSNEDGASFTNGSNEVRDMSCRPYPRSYFSKSILESRLHSSVTPSESNSYAHVGTSRGVERSADNSNPFAAGLLQNRTDLQTSPRPYTSSVRARSVSPISVFSSVAASIPDEPLDDIGINLTTSDSPSYQFSNDGFENNVQRPSTPLPPISSPTLSDDDNIILPSPTVTMSRMGNIRIATSLPRAPETCQSVNATMNEPTKTNLKEAPRTYDDLNNELIQLLECPICFEYATPPISQCLQGHIICHTCRQRVSTCPTCRTVFQESRNLIMEKVAALLRYPCRNAVTGCPEFLYLLQKLEHEKACGFRQYACFLPLCTWRGYKPELLVHVQETHENHVVLGSSTNLLIPVSGQSKKVWLMSAFNELFYVIFFTTRSILKGCVRFIGDSSKCESFSYNISMTSEDDMLRNFNYTRRTHAYEESTENSEMIDSYDLFSISHAQLNLFRKGTKAPVRVTIEELPRRGSPASSNVC